MGGKKTTKVILQNYRRLSAALKELPRKTPSSNNSPHRAQRQPTRSTGTAVVSTGTAVISTGNSSLLVVGQPSSANQGGQH